MYLFDTDTITNIFKPEPSKRLLKRLASVPPEQQYISAVTVYEIVYGAYKSARQEHHLQNLKELLLPQVQVADFDMKAAFVCGALRADLERSGETIPSADLQVASIAIAHELVLITGNVKHFVRIKNLNVESWL
jgi:tRNA(fMet)-specific endonuclease VapC